MATSLTSSVNYSLKPVSLKCTRKTVVIPSSNKTTFNAQDTIVLYLPSLREHTMDGQSGYLRFNATITTAGRIDHSAHSFIDRITTYGAGGQVISDIMGYGVLAAQWLDLSMSASEKIGLSSMLGTEDSLVTPTAAAAAFATANQPTAAEVASIVPVSNRQGAAVATATTYSFAIPLLHPLFALSEKAWPSFAFSDDTRIEITLASVAQALVSSTVYTISNPELVVDYIQFDSSVFPLIRETYKGRDLVIPSQDYRYFSSQIAAGTSGNISQIIPCKALSARAAFFAFRPASTQGTTSYTTSSRVNPFYQAGDSFNLNIGGQRVPNKPITTSITGNFAPWFAATQSALHSMNSIEMNGSLNTAYYQTWSAQNQHSATTSSFKNGFALAINLDTLRGQSELSNSGLNLSTVTTYYEGYLANIPKDSTNTNTAISVDCHILTDVLFIVDSQGNVSVRF